MNLKDLITAFKAGKAIANPTAWKKGQVHVNQIVALLAVLLAVARFAGIDLHMDDDTLAAVGAGVFALVNWLCTVVSTDRVGITGRVPAEPAPADPAQDDVRGGP